MKINWGLPRALLSKNRVKLLLNLMLVAGHAIPRGGVLTIDPVGEGESVGFRIEACGLNARVPQAMAVLVAGGEEGQTIDAHAIQPFYTGLLAKTCGMTVAIESEGEAVIIVAQ